MRTTVTLDDDVAAAIERIRAESRTSFKQVLNDLIRDALRVRARRTGQGEVSLKTTRARNLGPRLGNFDQTSDLIALIEGEAHR